MKPDKSWEEEGGIRTKMRMILRMFMYVAQFPLQTDLLLRSVRHFPTPDFKFAALGGPLNYALWLNSGQNDTNPFKGCCQ